MVPVITHLRYNIRQQFLKKVVYFNWDEVTPVYSTIKVYYDIYLNNEQILRTENNFFSINKSLGCALKCVKVKTVFEDTITDTFSYSDFSEELCYYDSVDTYCGLKKNIFQTIRISDEEKKEYNKKLEKLSNKKVSSKMKYARAVSNKHIAAAYTQDKPIRSAYYKECSTIANPVVTVPVITTPVVTAPVITTPVVLPLTYSSQNYMSIDTMSSSPFTQIELEKGGIGWGTDDIINSLLNTSNTLHLSPLDILNTNNDTIRQKTTIKIYNFQGSTITLGSQHTLTIGGTIIDSSTGHDIYKINLDTPFTHFDANRQYFIEFGVDPTLL